MFNFFKKKAEVLNHWIAFCDGFDLSPTDFYTELEHELRARDVPRMEMSRIDVAEGGLLSEKRIYLRMLRERIIFDVCASPFGNGFFFSCRTAEIPLELKPAQVIVSFVAGIFLVYLSIHFLGLLFGILACLSLLLFSIYLMRNALAMGLRDVDKALIESPLIGSIYEVFFRRQTYHRFDSQLCYIHTVPTIVKKLAEEATADKGIKLVEQFERSPILGELYRPSRPFSDTAHSSSLI
jgi:hypothetical protein